METKIKQKLKEIEKEHEVEILFAAESGSRAWGFASPDSDYDIRFVYRHSKDWYLNLWDKKDSIEFMTEDDLDGSGWDLRKALLLMAKTNASFLGWVYSPIVYFADELFLDELQILAQNNFNPVAAFHHFHSMNRGFEEVLNTDEINVKRFFYFFRTVMAANWIAKKSTNPPVLFQEMYDLIDVKHASMLDDLIEEKSKTIEKAKVHVRQELIDLGRSLQEENEKMKNEVQNKKANHNEFNDFFLKNIE